MRRLRTSVEFNSVERQRLFRPSNEMRRLLTSDLPTIQDALTTTFLFVNNTNVAGAASLILRNSGIGVNRGWRITSDSGTDQLSITDEGVGIMAMFTSAKNLVLHTVSTIQPASLAKGIVLADGTAASGDPTTASAIWSVAGSLQYRTSAAN